MPVTDKERLQPEILRLHHRCDTELLPDIAGMPINIYADEIETPVLLIHGEKAHSRYFSEDVYKKMKGNNKELLIIPGAVHTDLYDHMDVIPFAKIAEFFKTNLK